MKNLKEQNPLILAFAIIGVCALLYGGWTLYQQHISRRNSARSFSSADMPDVADYSSPARKPPPQ